VNGLAEQGGFSGRFAHETDPERLTIYRPLRDMYDHVVAMS
jgi:hypothetical protein